MLLYTKEPYELIFQNQTNDKTVTKTVNGVLLEGCEQPDGLHITRVLSTDPKAYLRKEFSPGSIITLTQ
ncbi:YlzJ-like family protein [Acetanaerobacterium elongatum]|uniref:YlzJ-like protein n=1 Tax=Acetanaerobacterium elongatum TaxID=258515 RepID=A0A1H0AZY2_9FIRM|nr:YlzJ-like family protein [Acetanaerobacterium elongatum]SDN38929.1 YlzJ-like protein [Acetanaerobacterium elongatum]